MRADLGRAPKGLPAVQFFPGNILPNLPSYFSDPSLHEHAQSLLKTLWTTKRSARMDMDDLKTLLDIDLGT